MQEDHRLDQLTMALECLQAMAAGGIPDLDSPVS
jgi:hypothetical protein